MGWQIKVNEALEMIVERLGSHLDQALKAAQEQDWELALLQTDEARWCLEVLGRAARLGAGIPLARHQAE